MEGGRVCEGQGEASGTSKGKLAGSNNNELQYQVTTILGLRSVHIELVVRYWSRNFSSLEFINAAKAARKISRKHLSWRGQKQRRMLTSNSIGVFSSPSYMQQICRDHSHYHEHIWGAWNLPLEVSTGEVGIFPHPFTKIVTSNFLSIFLPHKNNPSCSNQCVAINGGSVFCKCRIHD